MRAVIGSDSLLRREGLARILRETGVDVVALTGSSDDLLHEVVAYSPALAIIDFQAVSGDSCAGLAAADAIRATTPGVAVFVLAGRPDAARLSEILANGSSGFGCLLGNEIHDLSRFRSDVRRVAEGGSAIDPAFIVAVGRPADQSQIAQLSPRELEALSLLAAGCSNAAIAEAMSITKKSAEQHVGRIYDKLDLDRASGVHQRVAAALLYQGCGPM